MSNEPLATDTGPLVGIIMGSRSDWETMSAAAEALEKLGVPHEVKVVSAHRTPDLLFEYASTARNRGIEVIVAGAGGAAHLPGMAASKTTLPVLGVPVQSKALNGIDSLLSIAQMPAGIPVGTLAIGRAGATNAGLLAAAILGNKYPRFATALENFRREQTAGVLASPGSAAEPVNIGILGGGQLGMMLAQAGIKLGHTFRCYDPDPNAPARIAAECIHEDYHDFEALHRFAEGLDVITYEFENVPRDAVQFVEQRAPVHPTWRALDVGQERLSEKQFLRERGIPVPQFASAESEEELAVAAREVGFPCVVKTCRFGYDGKGQFVLRTEEDITDAWVAVGGTPLIIEVFVPFDRELSIISVRGTDGDLAFYPLVENTHQAGILRRTIAPAARVTAALQEVAQRHATAILQHLDYVGVLTIEFFQRGDELIANEIAPRVHNSGHWSIEGAHTSQFENHIRAITGQTLGNTSVRGCAAMLNVIGDEPDYTSLRSIDKVYVHSYGKAPRAKRKLGHITVVADGYEELIKNLYEVAERVNG